ncbi:hypothetical protein GUITHDRAFT_120555 [Guillardia theta CCMP2712]|uniref:Uncharacterized protein n=1 Tax=Guillardia theta (strain CCMP2712) TaxID=905079 RepID=L1IBM2_GUITC|nr:hypothetical protein GUITHDRAFT_120555 [Guillardia theta CCMP2712]EKX33240.1 hypothetical protein GUITHDRAFT_120555 [Guillardia theta CCMP2712]|eukprot:XP_005820220.1 hypothetical protein GUITHDRAFT_120555 [Guillardia theta CCMP2712]
MAKYVIDASVDAYEIWCQWRLDDEECLPILYALQIVKPDLETAYEILKERNLDVVALSCLIEIAGRDPDDLKKPQWILPILEDEEIFSEYMKHIKDHRMLIHKNMFTVYEFAYIPDEELQEVWSSQFGIEQLWYAQSTEKKEFYREINRILMPLIEECKTICDMS